MGDPFGCRVVRVRPVGPVRDGTSWVHGDPPACRAAVLRPRRGTCADSSRTERLATVRYHAAQLGCAVSERGVTMFSSIGKFCVRRRRFVLAGALLLFVAGVVVGPGVFMHLKESNGSSVTESARG